MSRIAAFLAGALLLAPAAAPADDWPQWLGPKRDGVWRETGLLDKFPAGGPKVLWRTPIESGFAGPAVAGGRVYVADRRRARDEKGELLRPTRDGGFPGSERILCLNAADGKVIWKHEYDCSYKIGYPDGPRCTPLVHGGKVYTLGAIGDLLCLDAKSGEVIWSKNVAKEYKAEMPVWGYAAHPLIDGDLLYCLVGGEGSAVVAFHKENGREAWKALTCEEIGYAPPMIYEAGGKRQLIIWQPEAVNSLNPATGELYWAQPYPTKGKPQRPAVSIATPVMRDNRLYVSTFYHGGLMLKLDKDKPAASVLWQSQDTPRKQDGLHALSVTPVLKDGHLYGIGGEGELRCQKAETGEGVWESFQAIGGEKALFGSAFLTPCGGDRFVIFSDSGHLILADVSPKGYKELDRAKVLEPTYQARGRTVVWSAPAYARRCAFA
ncbi:MAG TPA: PQQ-binding-like beta-propeller repeat protein, partial [Gemmataceae bacterium]|nr:PQQ-binding-like beta-propeller repeat protein [Gemmataceae bacterium]